MKSPTDNKIQGFGEQMNDNRWNIVALLAFALLWFGYNRADAQIASSNPLEYVALAEGNELINAQIKAQIEDEQKTALLQNTIATEFTMIHSWEKKYNKYLKTVDGYASTLKACTTLYDDGVRVFINLCNLRKAISNNPQGIVATMSMNNLYIETATELVSVYTTLKDAIAKGGTENMLTGAERSISKTLLPGEKYNFTFWSSNAKYPYTASLRLDFSDNMILKIIKEQTYTGKEYQEYMKRQK